MPAVALAGVFYEALDYLGRDVLLALTMAVALASFLRLPLRGDPFRLTLVVTAYVVSVEDLVAWPAAISIAALAAAPPAQPLAATGRCCRRRCAVVVHGSPARRPLDTGPGGDCGGGSGGRARHRRGGSVARPDPGSGRERRGRKAPAVCFA